MAGLERSTRNTSVITILFIFGVLVSGKHSESLWKERACVVRWYNSYSSDWTDTVIVVAGSETLQYQIQIPGHSYLHAKPVHQDMIV